MILESSKLLQKDEVRNPSDPLGLWSEIETAVPGVISLERLVFDRLGRVSSYDEGFRKFTTSRRSRVYFLLYGLPLVELDGWSGQYASAISKLLAVHLGWCWLWRCIDDILDAPDPNPEGVADALSAAISVATFHQQLLGDLSPPALSDILSMATRVARVARIERTKGLPVDRIWERASPFLIVPTTAMKMPAGRIAAYRDFICAAGLLHDAEDLMDDIARGIVSMPSKWLTNRLGRNHHLSRSSLGATYKTVNQHIERLLRRVECQLPSSALISRTIILPWLRGSAAALGTDD